MRGPRRAVVLCAAAVVAGGLAAGSGWRRAPAGAEPVGPALAAPHIYAGGGVLGFGAPPGRRRRSRRPLNSVDGGPGRQSRPPRWRRGLLAGLGRRRGLRRGRRRLLRLARRTAPRRVRSWPWPPRPTAGATGWPRSTAGCSPSATPASTARWGARRSTSPSWAWPPTPDGKGYWLVASDGGVFAFGDAPFLGSMGGTPLVAPVIGMAATHHGLGYWMVAGDGGIFTFGDAAFLGSLGGRVARRPDGRHGRHARRRRLLPGGVDGGVFTVGDAVFRGRSAAGSTGTRTSSCRWSGITLAQGGAGYWLLDPDGFNYSFTNPPDPDPSPTASAIVVDRGQPGRTPTPTPGTSATRTDRARRGAPCSPPGCGSGPACPSRPTPSPGTSTTGPPTTPGVLPPTASPAPGGRRAVRHRPVVDGHLASTSAWWCRCGRTGRWSPWRATPGPAPSASLAVVINGPYLPSQSPEYNGMPIYAFAQP